MARAVSQPPPLKDLDCYTIDDFCKYHRISRSAYYRMREEGTGPTEIHPSRRVLITREAAQRWRAEQDAQAQLLETDVDEP